MEVSVDIRDDVEVCEDYDVEGLIAYALERMGCPDTCEVSVSFVSEAEIQDLNRDYRGVDSVTDVLSFECDDPFEAPAAQESIAVGDIVICPSVIDEQRLQFGTTFAQEASLMTVHSVLHLLGYDHMEQDERAQMEALEKEILDGYGLTGIR